MYFIRRFAVVFAVAGIVGAGSGALRAQEGGARGTIKAKPKPPGLGQRISTLGADPKAKPQKGKTDPGRADPNKPLTLISIELITGDEGVGIKAQRWTQVFDKLDVTLTIRRGTSKDKPEITQKTLGDLTRQVHIVGELDRSGRIEFSDRIYTEDDVEKLAAWLDELRDFGAQGTPEGQPAWGLTKQQFGELHESLGAPLTADTAGDEFVVALKKFQFPETLPVRLTPSAAELLKSRDESKSQQSLEGMSRGTALAILLSEQGLAFHPRRRQDGTIELTIAPAGEVRKPWPVGWPLQNTGPATAPKLFKFYPIDLQDIELDAVLEAAGQVLEVPIYCDRGALAALEIDLSQVKVTQKPKRTTWKQALDSLLFQAKAKFELLIDEAGKPFLWVIPVKTPRRPQNH